MNETNETEEEKLCMQWNTLRRLDKQFLSQEHTRVQQQNIRVYNHSQIILLKLSNPQQSINSEIMHYQQQYHTLYTMIDTLNCYTRLEQCFDKTLNSSGTLRSQADHQLHPAY